MENESDTEESEQNRLRRSDESNQVGTSGDVNNGDNTQTDFRGRFLRFVGMSIIAGVVLIVLFVGSEVTPAVFGILLVFGVAGAAMHYQGRKRAPGRLRASILGGLFGPAVLIIAGLIFIAVLLSTCRDFINAMA